MLLASVAEAALNLLQSTYKFMLHYSQAAFGG